MFSYEKLDDLNRQHILKMDKKDYNEKVFEFLSDEMKEKFKGAMGEKIIELVIRERIQKFSEVSEMEQEGEFGCYFETPEHEVEKLIWKEDGSEVAVKHLNKVIEMLGEMDDLTAENVKEKLWDYASEEGRGSVLWPMRYALSGRDRSPDPFTLAGILGKDEVINRLKLAVDKLN